MEIQNALSITTMGQDMNLLQESNSTAAPSADSALFSSLLESMFESVSQKAQTEGEGITNQVETALLQVQNEPIKSKTESEDPGAISISEDESHLNSLSSPETNLQETIMSMQFLQQLTIQQQVERAAYQPDSATTPIPAAISMISENNSSSDTIKFTTDLTTQNSDATSLNRFAPLANNELQMPETVSTSAVTDPLPIKSTDLTPTPFGDQLKVTGNNSEEVLKGKIGIASQSTKPLVNEMTSKVEMPVNNHESLSTATLIKEGSQTIDAEAASQPTVEKAETNLTAIKPLLKDLKVALNPSNPEVSKEEEPAATLDPAKARIDTAKVSVMSNKSQSDNRSFENNEQNVQQDNQKVASNGINASQNKLEFHNVSQVEKILPSEKHQPVSEQISSRVVSFAKSDETSTTVKFKLQPEDLGQIQITMTMEQQKLKIDIVAESSHTRALIADHIESLKENLSKSTFDLDKITVTTTAGGNFSQEMFREENRPEQSMKSFARFIGRNYETAVKSSISEAASIRHDQSSLVDMRL